MNAIYILPTCLGVLAAMLVLVIGRRRERNMIVTALLAAVSGAATWYVSLFAIVVLSIPPNAHG